MFKASPSNGASPLRWSRLGCICARSIGGVATVLLLVACAAAQPVPDVEPLTSVTTWRPAMQRQGEGALRITYTPPLSSQRQYTGANHQSEGEVMVVSLRSCLVSEECPTLVPAQSRSADGRARWFEVVVPYRGERVVVEGDGPGQQELSFTP